MAIIYRYIELKNYRFFFSNIKAMRYSIYRYSGPSEMAYFRQLFSFTNFLISICFRQFFPSLKNFIWASRILFRVGRIFSDFQEFFSEFQAFFACFKFFFWVSRIFSELQKFFLSFKNFFSRFGNFLCASRLFFTKFIAFFPNLKNFVPSF